MKLLELRVVERKCAKQAEMIRSALAELGCEEAPSGCPDLSAETVGVDSLDGSSPDHQVVFCSVCLVNICDPFVFDIYRNCYFSSLGLWYKYN